MIAYSEIAHLCQDVSLTPGEAHFYFVSDCGKFEQTVTVSREMVAVGDQSSPELAVLRWLRSALKRVLHDISCPPESLTSDELERLSLQAFEQISASLTQIDGRWIALSVNDHPGDFFERQLSAAPITEPYDKEVLVRVLLEVSRSDSEWRSEERLFLEEIVGDLAVWTRLERAPNLTIAELSEVSSVEVKHSILMLAWAMAYADGTLDVQEMTRLTHLCRGFMLQESRVRELQLAAKLSLLDRYLDAQRGQMPHSELRLKFDTKAIEWGICEHNLCKLRAWYPNDFPDESLNSSRLVAADES